MSAKSDVDVERIVAVVANFGQVTRVGSGYLIRSSAVLTAWHCIADPVTAQRATSVQVWRLAGAQWASAPAARLSTALASRLEQPTVDGWGLDIALLELDDPPWDDARWEPPEFVRVDPTDDGVLTDCVAVGFPAFSRLGAVTGEDLTLFPVRGDIRCAEGAGSASRMLTLRDRGVGHVSVPPPPRGALVERASPWGGVSGALVFHAGAAVGHVVAHDPARGDNALRIVPVDRVGRASGPRARAIARLLGVEKPGRLRTALSSPSQQRVAQQILDLGERMPAPRVGDIVGRYRSESIDPFVPGQLADRTNELERVAALIDGDVAVLGWQAPEKAGKSGLLFTLAAHGVTGAHVIPFFISIQRVGRNDRRSFIQVTGAFLADAAGMAYAPVIDDGDSLDTLWEKLLGVAATATARDGRKLLLIVDALDEDAALGSGKRASIAALLPADPAALSPNLRLLVTARPHPGLPKDVPHAHWLRSEATWEPLSPSALAAEAVDPSEIDALMRTRVGRGIAGVLAAAGGPVTDVDLAVILDVDIVRLRDVLGSTKSRNLVPVHTEVGDIGYTIGHATSLARIVENLDPTLAGTDARSRANWADVQARVLRPYRARIQETAARSILPGADLPTPYLLSDAYVSTTLDEPERRNLLVEVLTRRARHAAQLERDGTMFRASNQLLDAIAATTGSDGPSLSQLSRLLLARELLDSLDPVVSTELIGLYARLGDYRTARELAASHIDDLGGAPYCAIARAATTAGDPAVYADAIERAAGAVASTDLGRQSSAWEDIAVARAFAGDTAGVADALKRVKQLPEGAFHGPHVSRRIATAYQEGGFFEPALQLAGRLEDATAVAILCEIAVAAHETASGVAKQALQEARKVAGSIRYAVNSSHAWTRIAAATRRTGVLGPEWIADLNVARASAEIIVDPEGRALAWATIARELAAGGARHDLAAAMQKAVGNARLADGTGQPNRAWGDIVAAYAATGDQDGVGEALQRIDYAAQRSWVITENADALVAGCSAGFIDRLLGELHDLTGTLSLSAGAWEAIAEIRRAMRDMPGALQAAARLPEDSWSAVKVRLGLAAAAAERGDYESVHVAVDALPDPADRQRAWTEVAAALVDRDDADSARAALGAARASTEHSADLDTQMAFELAGIGRHDDAVRIAGLVPDLYQRIPVLLGIAQKRAGTDRRGALAQIAAAETLIAEAPPAKQPELYADISDAYFQIGADAEAWAVDAKAPEWNKPTLTQLHGLYGSGREWHDIPPVPYARRLFDALVARRDGVGAAEIMRRLHGDGEARARIALARLLAEDGDPDAAAHILDEMPRMLPHEQRASVHADTALTWIVIGDDTAARTAIDHAIEAAMRLDDPSERAPNWARIARACHELGDKEGAALAVQQARADAELIAASDSRGYVFRDIARLYVDTGALEEAAAIAGAIPHRSTRASAWTPIAEAFASEGRLNEAADALVNAWRADRSPIRGWTALEAIDRSVVEALVADLHDYRVATGVRI